MISRTEALTMLKNNGATESLMRHALASGAVMAALARKLDADANLWYLTGLLHDVDFPQTEDNPREHGIKGSAMLADLLPPEALAAIRAHNGEMNGCQPETGLDFALRCAESVTGLIAAAALMRPTGYDGMAVKSIRKKMKDKAFAANVSRANILQCEQAGMDLDDFLALAIAAMAEMEKNASIAPN